MFVDDLDFVIENIPIRDEDIFYVNIPATGDNFKLRMYGGYLKVF